MSVRRTVLPPDSPEWASDLIRELRDILSRLRTQETQDTLNTYTVATLPSVTGREKAILVSDETGGFTMAFTDGTNWRRVQDRAVVS